VSILGSLSNVRSNERFILADGRHLQNLVELGQALKGMDPHVFSHHVTAHKNDFSQWVRDCVKDHGLAEGLKHAKTNEEAYRMVSSHIQRQIPPADDKNPIPTPWPEVPPDREGIVRDIALLSNAISEESFIRAYEAGEFTVTTRFEENAVKESDAGIVVLRGSKQPATNAWQDNFNDLPIFSTDVPNYEHLLFYKKVTALQDHIARKNTDRAKELYNDLKKEFEKGDFDHKDRKSVYSILNTAYHEILSLDAK
jgi:hypothetical protein